LQTWLEGKETTKARSTFLGYRKAVNDFLAHLGPERASLGLELVNVRDFQSFRDKQVKEGKTPQTANNVLKILRIPFSLARKHGLIPMNPAEAIERLSTERVARGTFTTSQLRALVAAADGDWRGPSLRASTPASGCATLQTSVGKQWTCQRDP
jgi:site-specific recombinase XerD